jgi:hypothetical protein
LTETLKEEDGFVTEHVRHLISLTSRECLASRSSLTFALIQNLQVLLPL